MQLSKLGACSFYFSIIVSFQRTIRTIKNIFVHLKRSRMLLFQRLGSAKMHTLIRTEDIAASLQDWAHSNLICPKHNHSALL